MYKILVLLFIPFSSFASFTFYELPSSFDKISELKSKYYSWGFDDWEEMQKDPDVEVEDYRAFIGARCGGLYQARIETLKKYVNGSSLYTKLLAMNKLIEKYSLDIYTDAVSSDSQVWGYFKKHMYKDYYIELYNFSMKHDFKLTTLLQDREICEKEYEKYFS